MKLNNKIIYHDTVTVKLRDYLYLRDFRDNILKGNTYKISILFGNQYVSTDEAVKCAVNECNTRIKEAQEEINMLRKQLEVSKKPFFKRLFK
jgi:hypothetical protein